MELPKEYRDARRNLILVSTLLWLQQMGIIDLKSLLLQGLHIPISRPTAIGYGLAALAGYFAYRVNFEREVFFHEKPISPERWDHRGSSWSAFAAIQTFCVTEMLTSPGQYANFRYFCATTIAVLSGFLLRFFVGLELKPHREDKKLSWTDPRFTITVLLVLCLPVALLLHFDFENVRAFQFVAAFVLSLISFSQVATLSQASTTPAWALRWRDRLRRRIAISFSILALLAIPAIVAISLIRG